MENKIEKAIKQYGMDVIFDGAIIGFSGGADSSAILHYLSKRTKKRTKERFSGETEG